MNYNFNGAWPLRDLDFWIILFLFNGNLFDKNNWLIIALRIVTPPTIDENTWQVISRNKHSMPSQTASCMVSQSIFLIFTSHSFPNLVLLIHFGCKHRKLNCVHFGCDYCYYCWEKCFQFHEKMYLIHKDVEEAIKKNGVRVLNWGWSQRIACSNANAIAIAISNGSCEKRNI